MPASQRKDVGAEKLQGAMIPNAEENAEKFCHTPGRKLLTRQSKVINTTIAKSLGESFNATIAFFEPH